MTDDARMREVWGFTHQGERIHLGNASMTDDAVHSMLAKVAEIYGSPGAAGWFNVRSAVFDMKAFAGIQILPPATREPADG